MNICKFPECSNTTSTKFCSPSCAGKFGNIGRVKKLYTCNECGSETYNIKFCSRSCAASHNNRLYPKKTKSVVVCREEGCDSTALTKRATLCTEHNPLLLDYDSITIGDLKEGRSAHRFSTIVRHRSRIVFANSNKEPTCIFCEYTLHIEVAHIHAISDYPLDTPLSVVNDISNLEAMCRRCHWEFDNEYLSIDQRIL